MGLVSIVDIQSSKNLTGFNYNAVINDNADISGLYTSIPRTVQAYRLKVDKLTRLDCLLNNFIGLKESDILEEYITRFRGDVKLNIYIGADTFFSSKTTLDDVDPDGDLVTAGMYKLADFRFTDTQESNIINVSQEYPERSIPVDLSTIKSEKSISSSDVTLIIFIVVSGSVNILNVEKTLKANYIFNFILRGSRFFFSPIIDTVYPVGSFYVQYPDSASNTETVAFPTAKRPAALFGGTWAEQFSTEYVFFRTGGTDGQTRTNGLSLDQNIDHQHIEGADGYSSYSRYGAVPASTVGASETGGGVNTYLGTLTSGQYGGRAGSFAEPRNRLIKIWKRTA